MNYIERSTYRGATEIVICQSEAPTPQAQFAMELMRNMILNAIIPKEGELDPRLMTETELVDRAILIATIAWREFRSRDWLLDLPIPKVETEKQ